MPRDPLLALELLLKIVGVVPGLHEHLPLLKGNNLVADTVEKVAVVADHQNGPPEVGESFLQHAQARKIEVIGRFIQNENIPSRLQDLGKKQAGTLAPGEHIDAFLDALVTEKIPSQVGPGPQRLFPEHNRLAALRDLVENRAFPIQDEARLIDIVEHTALPYHYPALFRPAASKTGLEQGRLADPVPAHDPRTLSRLQREIQISEEPAALLSFPNRCPDLLHVDRDITEGGRCRKKKVHLPFLGRRLQACHRVKLIETVSRLGGPCLDPRAHPFQFLTQETLPPPLGLLGDLLPRSLRLQIGGVVPSVRITFSLIQLDHPGGDHIEKIAIVRHENERPCKRLQKLLQPTDRFSIQMVRGLIEQEEVRLRGESTAKCHPPLFPSGKWPDGIIQ